MWDMIDRLQAVILDGREPRFRDRRAHSASDNQKCLRDQYWKITGVAPTNPFPIDSACKMMAGDALERALVYHIGRLHLAGIHLLGTQVPVGGSVPVLWNGYLDGLIARRDSEGAWEKAVLEIKTKYGNGAAFFWKNPEPDRSYMAQIGLYLKDLYEKDGVKEGMFLYFLMGEGESSYAKFVSVDCRYEPETNTVIAYAFQASDGRRGQLDVRLDLTQALERWVTLEKYLDKGEEPPGEFVYKYELTPERLASLSKTQLSKIVKGEAVVGDWQVLYSSYKDLQLERDGVSPGRTLEERQLAWQEYKRRVPKARLEYPKAV